MTLRPPRTLLSAALCLSGLAPALASAPDWRDQLAEGWLAVVVAEDLDRFDRTVERLTAPWGLPAFGVGVWLDRLGVATQVADRAWVLSLVRGASGAPGPELLVPTDDFDGLCVALGADRVEDLAIVSVGGYEFGVRESGGWARVAPLESIRGETQRGAGRPEGESAARVTTADADITFALSPAGAAWLAEELSARRAASLVSKRRRPNRWPTTLREALDRADAFAPLAQAVADWRETSQLRLSGDDPSRLVAMFDLPSHDTSPATGEPLPLRPGRDEAIAWLATSAPPPATLVDLAIAVRESRPGEIDARHYPAEAWAAYAQSLRALVGGVGAAEWRLLVPRDGAPVATNEACRFRWQGTASELGESLQAVVAQWNALVDATEARTPLRAEAAPREAGDGWRLTVDFVNGLGLKPTEELVRLLERFYGPGGRLRYDVLEQRRGEWLATSSPDEPREAPAAGEQAAAPSSDALLQGEFRPDRWLAWRERVEAIGHEATIGRRVRPPMAPAPPVALSVRSEERLRVEFALPAATYDELAAYWRRAKERSGDD